MIVPERAVEIGNFLVEFSASEKYYWESAREDWKNQNFPKVPGETEFVPLPN